MVSRSVGGSWLICSGVRLRTWRSIACKWKSRGVPKDAISLATGREERSSGSWEERPGLDEDADIIRTRCEGSMFRPSKPPPPLLPCGAGRGAGGGPEFMSPAGPAFGLKYDGGGGGIG